MTNLAIINNHDSFTYNLVDLVRRLNVDFQVINVEDVQLTQLETFSHILISPGPDVPQAYPILFQMLERFYQQKPILGVCLGHQTICEFFGGKLFNLSKVRHGHKKQLYLKEQSKLFEDLPNKFNIGLYHSWAVSLDEQFPSQLKITGICEEGILMAVEHKEFPVFAVQFHPESYISEYGKQILQNFLQQ